MPVNEKVAIPTIILINFGSSLVDASSFLVAHIIWWLMLWCQVGIPHLLFVRPWQVNSFLA